MSKKDDKEKEKDQEIQELEKEIETTNDEIKAKTKEKPVNPMENAEKGGKPKSELAPDIDFSPILNKLAELDQRLTNVIKGKEVKLKPEPKKDLIEVLGDW